MRKILFVLMMALSAASCIKSKCNLTQNTNSAPQAEQDQLQTYITNNNIIATKDPAGYFYQIITPGNNDKPGLCSNMTVTYTGKLIDGRQFDAGTASFQLGSLIEGWKRALPKIGEGGKIKLYLPPSFAYGSREIPSRPPSQGDPGSPGIPANSILIFDVELKQIF